MSITVRTLDDLGELHTDAVRLGALLSMAVQYACGLARSGTIELAAVAGAPGSPASDVVLFTVTCSGYRGDTEASLFNAARGAATAARSVGLASLPPGLRTAVEAMLGNARRSAVASPHEHTYRLIRAASDARATQSSSAVEASFALAMAGVQAEALGAHIGLAARSAHDAVPMTRLWLVVQRRLELVVNDDADTPSFELGARAAALESNADSEHPHSEGAGSIRVAPSGLQHAGARSGGATRQPHAPLSAATVVPTSPPISAAGGQSVGYMSPPQAGVTRNTSDAPATGAVYQPIKRVMLVDDEITLRRLGSRMLAAQGVECDVLEDGSGVAGSITSAHELLLLDIVMRQSDGVEVRAAEGMFAFANGAYCA